MSADREPVAGRFYPRAGACFATLDVTALVDNNVHDLLELLMYEFFEDFHAVACAVPTGEHDGFAPDRLAFEELKARLVERLATRLSMTAPQADRIGAQLQNIAASLDNTPAPQGASEIGHPAFARTRRFLKASPLPVQKNGGQA